MRKMMDLTGQRFDRLLVISAIPHNLGEQRKWLCRCDCGNEVTVFGGNLKRGLTRSCRCLNKEITRSIFTKHGDTVGGKPTTEYKTWCHIKDRCYNPDNKQYQDWGGRGIKMCDRWLSSFHSFLEDMGRKPSPELTIDRINNDGDYEPGNCKWGTDLEQAKNKRNNKWYEANGERKHLREWSRVIGMDSGNINYHLRKGKTMTEIIAYYKKLGKCPA